MADGQIIAETTNLPSRLGQEDTRGSDAPALGMNALMRSQTMAWSGMIAAAEAMHAFSQSRLDAHMKTSKMLISCLHPMELVGLHQKHMQDAMAQYQDHAQDMSERLCQCVFRVTTNISDVEEV